MSVEVSTHELKRFMNMLESVSIDTYGDVMVTAESTSSDDALLIGRGGKNKPWMISVVEKKEVEAWPGPE
jgi:hypothetical protein